MWAGVVARCSQGERENVARVLRIDDRIHEAARRGVSRVELMLVVGAHLVDRLGDLTRNRLAADFRGLERGTVHRLDGRFALHDAHPSRIKVWADPRSLATTYGIIGYFLFLGVLRCFSSPAYRSPRR